MEYTRKDYINGHCTHNDYYSQFVTNAVLDKIELFLKYNKHPKLCDWDMLNIEKYIDTAKWKCLSCPNYIGTNQYAWSLSDNVCIAKQAARLLGYNY